jgi:ribosome maturation factor RimP
MDDQHLGAIRQLVEPLLAERQTELVELGLYPQSGGWLLRVLVDRPGGINLADCAAFNQALGQAVDAAGLIESHYTVEVSSPGLDRPLTTRRDFERAIGKEVVVQLHTPDGRYQERRGMVQGAGHEALVLKTPAGMLTLAWAEVKLGKQQLRW